MSDVLFIHPPVSFNASVGGGYDNVPPLGLLYIAAVLERDGIDVDVLDILDGSMSLDDVIAHIEKTYPRIIGISATTCQIKTSVEIAKTIRNTFGNKVKIVIGGCHISADPQLIERHSYFDLGVTGEAETTFPEIVRQLLNGQEAKGIFRAEPPMDLDSLPVPAFHLIDWGKYKKAELWRYPMFSGRGCPYQCIFCSRPSLSNRVRVRSADNLIAEMIEAEPLFQGQYMFLDDSFGLVKSKVVEFCDQLIDRKLNFSWHGGGMRFDRILDEALIEKMVRAGCTGFCLGIESADEELRNKTIKKKILDEHIYRGLEICNKYPMDISLALMLGFPGENREQMLKTAMFARELLDMGIKCVDEVAIMLTVPLPGAQIFDDAIREQLIPETIIDQYIDGELGDGFRNNWPIYVPKGITAAEMSDIRKKGYLQYYYSTRYIWKHIKRDITSWQRLKKDVTEAASLLRTGRSRASFS